MHFRKFRIATKSNVPQIEGFISILFAQFPVLELDIFNAFTTAFHVFTKQKGTASSVTRQTRM